MMELSPGAYAGAGERAGTYTLTVTADGFEPEALDDIVVEAAVCHVMPATRDISLTPQ